MIVFAGIHEVTKELDDMHVYDFKNKEWYALFEEISYSPKSNISKIYFDFNWYRSHTVAHNLNDEEPPQQ